MYCEVKKLVGKNDKILHRLFRFCIKFLDSEGSVHIDSYGLNFAKPIGKINCVCVYSFYTAVNYSYVL